jgi:hypothetical protein
VFLDSHRIEKHVTAQRQKIAVGVDKQSLVSSLVKVAAPSVPPVKIDGVGGIDSPGTSHDTSAWAFYTQRSAHERRKSNRSMSVNCKGLTVFTIMSKRNVGSETTWR